MGDILNVLAERRKSCLAKTFGKLLKIEPGTPQEILRVYA